MAKGNGVADRGHDKAQLADAILAHQRGDLEAAERSYRKILDASPDSFDATHLLGVIAFQRGQATQAEELLGRATVLNPNSAAAFSNLGNVFKKNNRPKDALRCYDRAVAIDPKLADAHSNRGNALHDLHRLEEAIASYDCAIELKPDYSGAHGNRASVLKAQGRLVEALAGYERAIALAPESADYQLQRADVLAHLGRHGEALEAYDRLLAASPDLVRAISNRGIVLHAMGRDGEAVASYDKALELAPNDASACNNRANILMEEGRLDEAQVAFERAITISPNFAEAHYNKALLMLMLGNYRLGWSEHEFRWKKARYESKAPGLSCPMWAGEPLKDRSLAVFAEQGLGDVIMFSRFLPLLQARGAKVSFLVAGKMHRLLQRAFPGVRLFATAEQAKGERFDFQCAMMSLPLHFRTQVLTIPAQVPYLRADPEKVALWRKRLGTGGAKVGICWQGNPAGAVDKGRSIPLAAFAPLSRVKGLRLISLQKQFGLDQLDALPAGMKVETLGAGFDDGPHAFEDALGVVANLDLIVTSDTSIAHLAGALGRDTWVALKWMADWRWLLERDDSPWYPSLRLFRQHRAGNWDAVFSRIAAELAVHGR